ncbi:ribonuclease H-like protein [Cucurbitaria berberidis CBS 394.84]|uniref:Ribonuclease H-like protein n=1 Tax=Cucurbitaria berberidis CBS 394.84 TaxID=1168544 RepID=A0A9P4LD40_9PLEO|nr:ribonuclease H-like protein [Cucurbitaria berberidis CBS 394.84]KAF1849997.1 ribonuclease H-like protein [Cucurbitaria berberidis CBS 394.84]
MAPKSRNVTAKALQALLVRIGSESSGTKAILHDRFVRDIHESRLFKRRPDWQARQNMDSGRKLRIMSIDMGIKNLAYCDVEVDYPSKDSLNATMEVLRWEKIDLVKARRNVPDRLPSAEKIKKGTKDEDGDVDPYSLPILSATAYSLVRNMILVGEPDIILIEKQRWRSGGGSAIQQWTIRVNTLEGMLWAVLETLHSERKLMLPKLREPEGERDYEVSGVDPKRVGHYWLAQKARQAGTVESIADTQGAASEEEDKVVNKKEMSRSKAEKKAKIAILRSWLSCDPPTTACSIRDTAPRITFKFGSNNAERTRQALCSPSKPARRKKSGDSNKEDSGNSIEAEAVGESELKKLDDITDCFLQAAAWVSWESNRLQLLEVHNRRRSEDGSVAELSEEVLLEMVKEVGEGG